MKDTRYIAVRMELYPNNAQARALLRTIEIQRYVYNAFLTYCRLHHQNRGRFPTRLDLNRLCRRFRTNWPGLKGSPFNCMFETARRVLDACRRCTDGDPDGSGQTGYPRYRQKARSFGYLSSNYFSVKEECCGRKTKRYLVLCRVGRIRARGPDMPMGIPRTIVVSARNMGTHHSFSCSVSYDVGKDHSRDTVFVDSVADASVGVDLGLRSIAYLSDGTHFEIDVRIEELRKGIATCSRRMALLPVGSPGYLGRLSVMNHKYVRMNNIRKNMNDVISSKVVYGRRNVFMEDLSFAQLRDIIPSGSMRRAYSDAGLWNLTVRIREKIVGSLCKLTLVRPYHTSQTCSRCGNISPKDASKQFVCRTCGFKADRDYNASINILRNGLDLLASPNGNGGKASVSSDTGARPYGNSVRRSASADQDTRRELTKNPGDHQNS